MENLSTEIATIPSIRSYDREFLRCSFVKSHLDEQNFENLEFAADVKTVTEQEEMLIEDLLYVLQGIEGNFITISAIDVSSPTEIQFSINPSFDISLRTLASRILPLSVDFHTVSRFLDAFSVYQSGNVAQAFCSGVRTIVEEYLTLVCQLESQHRCGELSMQKLWFYIQPIHRSMKILATLCAEIETVGAYGGVILTLLNKKMKEFVGDKTSQDVCAYLLSAASKPYFNMLERWIYHGEICDPYSEFMISENVDKQRQISGTKFDEIDDWERRYVLKRELCPDYLFSVSDKILNCGKYLSILSLCAQKIGVIGQQNVHTLRNFDESGSFLLAIDEAHENASRLLVQFLCEKFSLMYKFKSLKHFFLVDHGDWLCDFFKLADDELQLCIDDVRPHRLESFMDIAIRSSSVGNDPIKDEIKVEIKSSSLTSFLLQVTQISGDVSDSAFKLPCEPTDEVKAIEGISVRYDADWPLSIVFNRKVMTQYQIIFRHLLMCKHVERSLSGCWMSKRESKDLAECLVLYEMITFIKNYMYYITAEVIEPNWHKFWTSLGEKSNTKISIDDVLREHSSLLDNCTKDCLLTEASLVEIIDRIFKLCLRFATQRIFNGADLKAEFDACRAELTQKMQRLSSVQQERGWAEIAYKLDLKL